MKNIKKWIYITKIYLKDNKIQKNYIMYSVLIYLFPIWIIGLKISDWNTDFGFKKSWNRYLFLSILFILSYLNIYYFIDDIKYIIIYNILQYVLSVIFINTLDIIHFYKSGSLNKKQMRKVKINSI